MLNNVSRQEDSSVEKRLAVRQLTVKNDNSNSWFIKAKHIMWKYDLGNALETINHPLPANEWKRKVNHHIDNYWKEEILERSKFYKTVSNLNMELYTPGKPHPLLRIPIGSAREIPRFSTRLKLVTGTYILQSNRSAFNQNEVDPVCKLCEGDSETLEHFLIHIAQSWHQRECRFSRTLTKS